MIKPQKYVRNSGLRSWDFVENDEGVPSLWSQSLCFQGFVLAKWVLIVLITLLAVLATYFLLV